MARLIREATRDGAELVEFALKVFRDENTTDKSREWAHEWLSDRGFGKPMQAVDMTVNDNNEMSSKPLDYANLTIPQLEALALLDVEDEVPDEPPESDDGGN
jgi:hypothetical protein